MYALVKNNLVTKLFTYPKGFELNNIQYSSDIFSKWSTAEKNAIGIYEVVTDSTNKKDEKWYINTNETIAFADNQVTRSWGTATPKKPEDENAVDEDGNNILDEDGNQVINYGLKTQLIKTIKEQASGLLAPTDWYVIKASEVSDYSVPTNIATYRASVRTKSNEMETAITNASDTPALETLYTYTEQDDGSVTRPLGELPTLEI